MDDIRLHSSMTRKQPALGAGLSFVLLAAGALPAPRGAAAATVEINLLYVHGVKSCQNERQNAQSSFTDLEQAVNADLMDDWEVGDPGCTTSQQGDPCTTAYEWRYRLAREINRLYPAPASNIVLI